MNSEMLRIMTEAIGRPLRKVIASVHLFEGKLDDEPLAIWLSFEGLGWIHLAGASDGWRLAVDGTLPEPADMEESGEIVVVDLSNKTVFRQMAGKELKGAWLMESPAGEPTGVRFDFGLRTRPVIINRDDELRIAADYSPENWEEIMETRLPEVAAG